ncbi:MAG: NAD+ synthase [Pseudobdellovibrionaceae bacterium]
MRIALAQINSTLGDFENNSKKIIEYCERAKEKNCSLVLFPECALFGYHPFDLLERQYVVFEQEKHLKQIEKKLPTGISAIVGLITVNKSKKGRPFYNSAALLQKGKKTRFFHKNLLPTGDVFDEARFIEPGDVTKNIFKLGKYKILMTICEDIWAWPNSKGRSPYKENPLAKMKKQKIDLVLNMSASPHFIGKLKQRKRVVSVTAKFFKAPTVYVNLVGAQDELIFDGQSFVVSEKGKVIGNCAAFMEDLNILDLLTSESGRRPDIETDAEELRQALVLGIQDFTQKTGLGKVHLGLSGGIDSAVVAALAVDALGPNKVVGFGLPGPYNDPRSLDIAKKLADNLGINFHKVSISETFENLKNTLDSVFTLGPASHVHENLQARIRGIILMAYSNKENSLLLATGNKSEYSTGYSTLYGDMCGGLAPIADLTKKQVYLLAEHYNRDRELIPKWIITRPPSAELRPDQKDQDTLPPYDDLDAAVIKIVENFAPAKTATEKWLVEAVFKTEFKRWQAPPILKVSAHAFGRGRRYPVVNKAPKY